MRRSPSAAVIASVLLAVIFSLAAALPPNRAAAGGLGRNTGTVALTLSGALASDGGYQPSFPVKAAFFYPWFPQAWTQQGIYPYSNYTPALGYYSSTDDAVIDQQLSLASTAHLDAFISSWWGKGDRTDTALQHILTRSARVGSPNPSLRWAIYYENESQGDPSSSQILADLTYLQTTVFSSPAYLRVDGKPVVFVYADALDASGMAQRWAQAKAQFGGNVYVVLKVYPGYTTDPNQPDSWHQYAPAVGYDSQAPYAVSVSPGFWLKGQAARLVRDPVRFESDVKQMVASNATWQLVTTWSEWGEGTIVEPSKEFGNTYVDILCRNLPGSTPCSDTSTPVPTNTTTPSSPTATSTPASGTYTFAPLADTYVRADQPSTGFGTSATLGTDNDPQKHILLKLGVSGLGSTSIASAKLRLYCVDSASVGGVFRRVASDDWSEADVTWSTAPAADSTNLATLGAVTAGSWYEVDLSSLITGDGTYSLKVISTSTDGADYTSREGAAANQPQLVVTTGQPGPSSTTTPTSTPRPTTTPAPTPPTSASLEWYPSIQQLLPTSAHVVWSTRGSGVPTVRYSEDQSYAQTATGESKSLSALGTYEHRVTLSGLKPNTTYNYEVYVGGADLTPSRSFSFKTAVAVGSSEPFSFIAFGDYGLVSTPQRELRDQMARDRFDFILTTGDNDQSSGTYSNYDADVFDVYTDLFSKVGLYPTVGNHDYMTSSGAPYRDIFDLPNGSTNYSFDVGPVHFISLDDQALLDSGATKTWLAQDLASTRQPWKIVAHHQPAYSSGTKHGSDLQVRTELVPLFEQYGVDFVFSGHNHTYERSVKINGVVYVVASAGAYIREGCTGATWLAFTMCTPTYSGVPLYTKLTVSGDTITLSTVDQYGAERDSAIYSKGISPTPTPTQAPTSTPTYSPTPISTNTSTPTPTKTPLPTATGTPRTLTLTPSADAYVSSSTRRVNYGTSAQIRVDASPIVRSYLTFSVAGVSGPVSKATLRVYATSQSSSGISVRGLANPSATWSETGITYANAPAIATAPISTSGPVAANSWVDFDVTSFVTGSGAKQLVLTTTGSTAIGLTSREGGANAPKLVIEYP